MKRYDTEMHGDDLLIEESPDGGWVRFDDAEAELQKERDRRVETQNQTLNEVNQRLEARIQTLGDELGRAELTIAKLEAHVEKRHECINCRACPCTETD